MKSIFILVPASIPTGPVKGAIALANELVKQRSVTFVTLKLGPGHDAWMDPRINEVSLYGGRGWRFHHWIKAYKKLLIEAGGRKNVVSISMCLSADMVNLFCIRQAILCTSVRGNLLSNYSLDYGYPGVPMAVAHLFLLRKFDYVVAMSSEMARQVKRFTSMTPTTIENFIDEGSLDLYRTLPVCKPTVCFVFLGSLTKRKQPFLLIDAFGKTVKDGMNARLDIIGSGPLMKSLRAHAKKLGINDRVFFHGQLSDPYAIVAKADALVLPSLSEGISRAAMEALYLGVPCVLRRVDGNGELVRHGNNGVLFSKNDGLSQAMREVVELSRSMERRMNLLPDQFRQCEGARRFLQLFD